MLTKDQKHHLFVAAVRTCDAWREMFRAWAIEERGGPEDPSATLRPVPSPEASAQAGNGQVKTSKKVEILSKRQPGTPEGHCTMTDAVELTGYSRDVLMSMIQSGTLKHRRGPSAKRPRIYIPETEVERLMEEKEKAAELRFVTAGRGVVYP